MLNGALLGGGALVGSTTWAPVALKRIKAAKAGKISFTAGDEMCFSIGCSPFGCRADVRTQFRVATRKTMCDLRSAIGPSPSIRAGVKQPHRAGSAFGKPCL
jgi:hypothetical protein